MGSRDVTRHCLVVSAVNFSEGGPLAVLQQFVDATCAVLPADWEIVVFLHDRSLLRNTRPTLVEIPYAKRSWLRRLRVEWWEFRARAHQLQPDLWVSLHDISPAVGPFRQAVYCHNPSPFFRLGLRDTLFEPSLLLFQLAYSLLYRIRIKRNCAVVVQQSWLRDRFRPWVGKSTRIIVAHPSAPQVQSPPRPTRAGPASFFYPALPRPFKNFELICRAVARLESGEGWQSEVLLTVDGTENRYSNWLKRSFGHLRTVKFVGLQTRAQMDDLYARVDCLLFPSRMETWGLPITEAKRTHLPMFVADLPYARETVGTYDRVEFIDIHDPAALAERLRAFQSGRFEFKPAIASVPEPPFVAGWPELVRALLECVT
jgi:glycosyltransferase involved in cell wall biosynthesis